jgi:hypothetical protein
MSSSGCVPQTSIAKAIVVLEENTEQLWEIEETGSCSREPHCCPRRPGVEPDLLNLFQRTGSSK